MGRIRTNPENLQGEKVADSAQHFEQIEISSMDRESQSYTLPSSSIRSLSIWNQGVDRYVTLPDILAWRTPTVNQIYRERTVPIRVRVVPNSRPY